MNIIRASQLVPLGDDSSANEGSLPGWRYFREFMEPVFKYPKNTLESYDTYIGFRHGEQGVQITLQAKLGVLFLFFLTTVLLVAATNGIGIIHLVSKVLFGSH
jgi:hypothetical protein